MYAFTGVDYQLYTLLSIHHCQLGETKIIADSNAQAAGWCVNDCEALPLSERVRLLKGDFTRNVNIKQVDLQFQAVWSGDASMPSL